MPLKILYNKDEYDLDKKVVIGRSSTSCQIVVDDDAVSRQHCMIMDNYLYDLKAANGTFLNGHKLSAGNKAKLRRKDTIKIGNTTLTLVEGWTNDIRSSRTQELCQTKAFGGNMGGNHGRRGDRKQRGKSKDRKSNKTPESKQPEPEQKESRASVEKFMEEEFKKIIGHDSIKQQLRQFHKKVQLDKIRARAGRARDTKRLYHMMFLGPPGTGKTTMANLVATIMVKMGIIKTNKVVFVNNALDLLAQYVGQTAPKVDAKVEEAKGGVLFIDEAYSIVKNGSGSGQSRGFGKEAIDTIMKHLDPPQCVFIFAGYEKEMEDFMQVNAGLARRIPYRYTFAAYSVENLVEIFFVMLEGKGEQLVQGMSPQEVIGKFLSEISEEQRLKQNAGIIGNWISFAQMERDDRIDIDEAERDPEICDILSKADLEIALEKVKAMSS